MEIERVKGSKQSEEEKAKAIDAINKKYFEKDKALERRFQKVMIEEPGIEDAISILRGLKDRYETHHP